MVAKHNGSGVHGVHLFITSRPRRNIKCVHEAYWSILGHFLVPCFAEADLQNYMFRWALDSENDYRVGSEPDILLDRKNTYLSIYIYIYGIWTGSPISDFSFTQIHNTWSVTILA